MFNARGLSSAIARSGTSAWLGVAAIFGAYLIGQIVAGPANLATQSFVRILRRRALEAREFPWWGLGLKPLPEPIRKQLWDLLLQMQLWMHPPKVHITRFIILL